MGFIDAVRIDGHAVESICRVLREQGCEVAARTYRSWKSPSRMVAARTVTDAVVVDALLATCGTPEGLYGRRKMVALLRRQGLPVAHCTVDRLMRDLGMNGVRRGRRVRTTVPDARASRPGDLLDRQFTAVEPDAVWVADFTYVRTWSGFAYVAFVVDCFAQRIVAWHAAMSRPADLVITPLRMAIWQRDHDGHAITPGQLIHHNDAGSQYTSIRFTEHLADAGIAPSIGTVGDAYDNALMESLIGLFKTEAIASRVFHDGPFKTLADVEFTTMAWVDWWNNRRLHGTLGMLTPAEFETAHYAALNLEPQPT
jgi:putative transposase